MQGYTAISGPERDTAAVSEQPLTAELISRICDAADRLSKVAGEIEDHGTRLFGLQSTGVEAAAAQNKPSEPQGLVEHLLLSLTGLDEQIARTHRAYGRIFRV